MSLPISHPKHKFFKKPCRRCDNLFRPLGAYSQLCKKCLQIRLLEGREKSRKAVAKRKLIKLTNIRRIA